MPIFNFGLGTGSGDGTELEIGRTERCVSAGAGPIDGG